MVIAKAILGVLKGKFGKKVPLKVQHYLTYKCNFRCNYCNLHDIRTKELDTIQLKKIISDFSKAGAVSWTFLGGEPLLRKDIKEVVLYAKGLGLHIAMTTNGSLVKKNIGWLHNINQITVSVDGPEKVNDKMRGRGSFKIAIEAVKLLKERNLDPFLAGVIHQENIKNDYSGLKGLLNIANDLKIRVVLLPIYNDNFSVKEQSKLPTKEEFMGAIKILECYKKKYGSRLVISYTALNWFFSEKRFKECFAGHFFCTIFPNGSISPCLFRGKEALRGENVLENFYRLPKVSDCSCNLNCYVEYNHLLSLNWYSIIEFLSQYGRNSKNEK